MVKYFWEDEDEDPEDEGTVILRNVTNYLPGATASYPRRLSFSDKRLFPRVHVVLYMLWQLFRVLVFVLLFT